MAYKLAGEQHCAFVVVVQMPRKHAPDGLQSHFLPYLKAAERHTLLSAMVCRKDVDVVRLVEQLRRLPVTDTLRELKKPDGADAVIACIAIATTTAADDSSAEVGLSVAPHKHAGFAIRALPGVLR